MTPDQLIAALARCRTRIKRLRDDNQRLWESRERWKRKHAERVLEIQTLRRRVKRLDAARERWKALAPPPSRNLREPNVWLSRQDVERILAMPVRRD